MSRIPAEILGEIFRWNTVSRGTFGALEKRSHNLLLVCHYWFEVASSTPELWGNNLEDRKKHNLRYPTVPLDISSRNALQDRASRDAIRCIHFASTDSRLLDSILSQLRADCDGIRPSSVESFVARDRNRYPSFDVSSYFARYYFPKLRRLELHNCKISSWDLIASRTSLLTTLTLIVDPSSPALTALQLISMLRSNSALREVKLVSGLLSDCKGGEPHPECHCFT